MPCEPFNRDVDIVLAFARDAVDADLSSMQILHKVEAFVNQDSRFKFSLRMLEICLKAFVISEARAIFCMLNYFLAKRKLLL